MVHHEIWRPNRETVSWYPKPWVSRWNFESWQVCFKPSYFSKVTPKYFIFSSKGADKNLRVCIPAIFGRVGEEDVGLRVCGSATYILRLLISVSLLKTFFSFLLGTFFRVDLSFTGCCAEVICISGLPGEIIFFFKMKMGVRGKVAAMLKQFLDYFSVCYVMYPSNIKGFI